MIVLVVALAGGGVWWHGRSNGNNEVGAQSASSDQSSSDDAGGLSVGGGQASELGQLNGGSSSSQQGGLNVSSGSGSSSGSGGVDPSTFSQYDKYLNGKSALFGDLKKGTGTTLGVGHKASVYYKGWLTNGTLFDQSPVDSSGQPQAFSFTLGKHEVIPGWEEGVYGMKTGGVRMVIVPPAVGYGAQGQGAVPPNAVMIFEIQLISVQ